MHFYTTICLFLAGVAHAAPVQNPDVMKRGLDLPVKIYSRSPDEHQPTIFSVPDEPVEIHPRSPDEHQPTIFSAPDEPVEIHPRVPL